MTTIDWLTAFIDETVVADFGEGFTVFGVLTEVGDDHLMFVDCDLHNQFEANSTRDVYALECKELGIRPNRKRLAVPRERLLAMARLDDVVG